MISAIVAGDKLGRLTSKARAGGLDDDFGNGEMSLQQEERISARASCLSKNTSLLGSRAQFCLS